ncbi:MAG TPA: cytochrome c [Candidatus Elarobacter sp.]|nr:cytochrome c [Candidatus Elarobacter sp.]
MRTARIAIARTARILTVTGAVLACACVTLSLSKGAPSAAAAADDPAIARGKTLFARVGCYECHGYAGQGGAAGPRIAARLPYAAFAAYVRHPAREMPPYTAKVLSDADLAAIHAYVASLPAPPSPAPGR